MDEKVFMTLKKFDSLKTIDFQNGAILNEIRNCIIHISTIEARVKELENRLEEEKKENSILVDIIENEKRMVPELQVENCELEAKVKALTEGIEKLKSTIIENDPNNYAVNIEIAFQELFNLIKE